MEKETENTEIFRVIERKTAAEFESAVNELLNDGYYIRSCGRTECGIYWAHLQMLAERKEIELNRRLSADIG